MQEPPTPTNEQERLHALSKYKLSELGNEKIFNQITEIASLMCEMPICLITIIDKNKQWFLSNHGLEGIAETPRALSFCAHAILDDKLMEITDATLDSRFQDNPFVVNSPKIRFYAGMPLVDCEGFKLGTICLIDEKARELNDKQEKILTLFSKMIVTIFETKVGTGNSQNREEKMSEIDNFKSALVQSIPVGILAIAQSGKIFFSNEKANKIFGYPDTELLNQDISFLIKDKEVDFAKEKMIRTQAIKKDLSQLPVELSVSPLKDSKHFVVVVKENARNLNF